MQHQLENQWPSVGERDGAHALHLVAVSCAAGAQNAELRVERDVWVRVVWSAVPWRLHRLQRERFVFVDEFFQGVI